MPVDRVGQKRRGRPVVVRRARFLAIPLKGLPQPAKLPPPAVDPARPFHGLPLRRRAQFFRVVSAAVVTTQALPPAPIRQVRAFRGVPLRRRSTFPFVVTQWSGSGTHTAVAYLYENVGIFPDITKDRPGVAYLYENVGLGPRWYPVLGRVVAEPGDEYGVAYVYENVT